MCALHRSWQKFEDLQKQWAAREQSLADEVGQYKADALVASSVMEENTDLKTELEAAKKAVSEATKEAKEKKEELRTCRLDRDYHADLANQKSALNDDLQLKLRASTLKCEQLSSEVKSLK